MLFALLQWVQDQSLQPRLRQAEAQVQAHMHFSSVQQLHHQTRSEQPSCVSQKWLSGLATQISWVGHPRSAGSAAASTVTRMHPPTQSYTCHCPPRLTFVKPVGLTANSAGNSALRRHLERHLAGGGGPEGCLLHPIKVQLGLACGLHPRDGYVVPGIIHPAA